MLAFSRRQLARYAVDQLRQGESPAVLAKRLSAALLVSKKHKEADLLMNDVAQELETHGLLVQAKLTSAYPLTVELRKELTARIKQAAKAEEVRLEEEVDKDVIGGIRIETANHTWDKTIARKLADIKGGI